MANVLLFLNIYFFSDTLSVRPILSHPFYSKTVKSDKNGIANFKDIEVILIKEKKKFNLNYK